MECRSRMAAAPRRPGRASRSATMSARCSAALAVVEVLAAHPAGADDERGGRDGRADPRRRAAAAADPRGGGLRRARRPALPAHAEAPDAGPDLAAGHDALDLRRAGDAGARGAAAGGLLGGGALRARHRLRRPGAGAADRQRRAARRRAAAGLVHLDGPGAARRPERGRAGGFLAAVAHGAADAEDASSTAPRSPPRSRAAGGRASRSSTRSSRSACARSPCRCATAPAGWSRRSTSRPRRPASRPPRWSARSCRRSARRRGRSRTISCWSERGGRRRRRRPPAPRAAGPAAGRCAWRRSG